MGLMAAAFNQNLFLAKIPIKWKFSHLKEDVIVKLRGSQLVKTHFKTNDNLKIAIGD